MCDLISGGLPSLQRAGPDFTEAPVANEGAMKNLATMDPEPLWQAPMRDVPHGPAATRDATASRKPPPPVFRYRGGETDPPTDGGSAYDSDWNRNGQSSNWSWGRQ